MSCQKKHFILLFLLIVIINFIVFSPSFFHLPRADQWHYLIETAEMDGLGEILGHSYSFPRNRVIFKGDEILFRPVFYFFLSVQKWLFGYNFVLWQVAGFLLHIGLLWQMLRVLTLIWPHRFSLLLVLNFSVLTLSQEMVIWHHISGYILFLILVLQSFYHFILYIQSGWRNDASLKSMLIFLTVSCFIYEFGVVCNIVFLLALLMTKKHRAPPEKSDTNKSLALMFVPMTAYFFLSLADYVFRLGFPKGTAGPTYLAAVFSDFWTIIGMAKIGVLFPCFITILPFSRSRWEAFDYEKILNFGSAGLLENLNMLLVLVINLVIVLFVLSLIKLWKESRFSESKMDRQNKIAFITIGTIGIALALLYILMIVAGRVSDRSLGYIVMSLYHFYVIILFFSIGAWTWVKVSNEYPLQWSRFIKGGVLFIFCLSAFLNAVRSYQYNAERRDRYRSYATFLNRLNTFVVGHHKDADFSYQLLWSEQGRPIDLVFGDRRTGQEIEGLLSDFLFRRYIDFKTPKYYLVYTKKAGIKVFRQRGKAEEYYSSIGGAE